MTTTAGYIAGTRTIDYDSVIQVEIIRGRFGVSRKISKEALEVVQARGMSVKDAIRGLSKNLIEHCQQYDQILSLDNAIRGYLDTNNGVVIHAPWQGKGRYLFPVVNYQRAMGVVRKWEAERAMAVEDFLFEYQTGLVAREERRLGPLFIPEQYPPVEELKLRFFVVVTFPPIDPRENVESRLQQVDHVAYEQALAFQHRKLEESAEKVQHALRRAMFEAACALREALVEGHGSRAGKPQRLHTTVIERLKDNVNKVQICNLTRDAELQQIGDNIKGLLDGISVAEMKSDEAARQILRERLGHSAQALERLIINGPALQTDNSE